MIDPTLHRVRELADAELRRNGHGAIPDESDDIDGRLEAVKAALRGRLYTADVLKGLPPPEPLVAGVLFKATTAVLWGPPGSSKSFVAQHLAMSIASGSRFDGRQVVRAPVLLVAAEGVSGLGLRIDAWQTHNQTFELPELGVIAGAVNLLDRRWRTALVELAQEMSPALVVIDTLARCIPGADENSAKDMGVAVEAMDEIRREARATVLAVHHSRKDAQTMRGSTALLGAVDTSIEVGSDGQLVVMRCEKQKDAPEFPIIRLWREPYRSSCVLISPPTNAGPDLRERHMAILRALLDIDTGGGMSSSAWEKSLSKGVSPTNFHRDKKSLSDAGLVVSTGEGVQKRWTVTDQGKEALSE